MKTNTEETIPGELKKFVVERDFSFRGERFKAGEELEVSADDALQLLSLHVGRMIGSPITIERCADGAHKISQWSKRYLVSDDFVKCEFLEDVPGWGVKVGDRRRLRRSDALEMRHKYINTPAPSPSQVFAPYPARILILEPRPVSNVNPEEIAERQAAVMAGMAKENDNGWVSSLKRI